VSGVGGVGLFLAAGTYATVSGTFTTTQTSTAVSTSNEITIGGLTGMTAGDVDVFVIRMPNALVTSLPPSCSELTLLKERADAQDRKIDELVRMLTHCHSPSPGSEPELILPEASSSLHIPREFLTKYLTGLAPASSSK